jgi:oxygen-independent coproporphyrinogen-3 oxidase
MNPISLYIHIPFCATKCPYCDFNTYSGIEQMMPDYLDALTQEITFWGSALGHSRGKQPIGTVFFGGGTPSYIPSEHIHQLMDTVRSTFDLASDSEITMECNPDDISPERLARWKDAGINRISMGVQSLDDGLLKVLGRRHTARAACEACVATGDGGFDNVNLDLMYGLPDQTLDQWQNTLGGVLEMKPAHLSLYCLTLEKGTPMEAWIRQGTLSEPDPDLAADMYLLAESMMDDAGYAHYEISNWALPGHESRHNLTYWRNQQYLGVGPGAHSYLNGCRFANLRSPRGYIKGMMDGAHPDTSDRDEPIRLLKERGVVESTEVIDTRMEMGETMMLGLRLSEGISNNAFEMRFGTTLQAAYQDQIRELQEIGLLQWNQGSLVLTPQGRLLGNEVFHRFLA